MQRRPGAARWCFGFLTYCLLLMVDQLPPRNGGAAVLETVDTVGDDAAIVASILTTWKVPTRLVSSPVGNDHHGQKVMNHLNAWGVDLEGRVSHEITTPVEVGIVDRSGGRTYFQRRDAAAMAALTPPVSDQLSGAGMLYVDWYDGPSIPAAMEIAFSRGVPVFLNLESRYNKDSPLTGMLRHTRICQVSLDEPGAGEDPVEVARWLLDQGGGDGPGHHGLRWLRRCPGTAGLSRPAPSGAGGRLLWRRRGLLGRDHIWGLWGSSRMGPGSQRPVRQRLRRAEVRSEGNGEAAREGNPEGRGNRGRQATSSVTEPLQFFLTQKTQRRMGFGSVKYINPPSFSLPSGSTRVQPQPSNIPSKRCSS